MEKFINGILTAFYIDLIIADVALFILAFAILIAALKHKNFKCFIASIIFFLLGVALLLRLCW